MEIGHRMRVRQRRGLTAVAQESSPIGALLWDTTFSRLQVAGLSSARLLTESQRALLNALHGVAPARLNRVI
ncbi:MAG: hypothetical protein JWM16_1753 [Verrucomicrobiales bacterium]|nr:hypothetical protein [Verrucomicrobiales bacterium]